MAIMNANTPPTAAERELPMLAAIAGIMRWAEEFLAILAGPLLTAGLMIALVDLLTDGKLLATQPEMLYGWAIAMGAGLDAQLVGASVKLGRAARQGRGWHAVGYSVLVLALAYVAFVAAQVFATQQADGLSTSQALSRLGMDSTTWLIQRSALSVALVVLSGLLRYSAPAVKGGISVAEIQAKQEVGLAQIRRGRAYLNAAFGKGLEGETGNGLDRPPTGPGSPSLVPVPRQAAAAQMGNAAQVASVRMGRRVPATRLETLRKRSERVGKRARAFDMLTREPDLPVTQLGKALGVRTETASAWKRAWELEQRQAAR